MEHKPEFERTIPERELAKADRLGTLITSLPKWMTLAVVAWQAGISIRALADRSALASLLITRFGRETSYWEIVCWVAGILGLFAGLYNWRLLKRQSTMDTARLRALERRFGLVAEPVPTASGPDKSS